MDVSVIIPVYNAAKFIEQAVKSALIQPETMEVILIEDGSPDNSLDVCRNLKNKYKKIRLFQHPNGNNRGASSSRNLGIRMSTSPYIAFLDADDFYLKNRFTKTAEMFNNNPDIEGVYGATGTFFTNNQVMKNWYCSNNSDTTSISEAIPPDKLFEALLFQTHGRFTTDAITVKKTIFKKAGLFNEKLSLHQDTDMWLKMALVGQLVNSQNNELVAVRRVHNGNRITKTEQNDFSSRNKFYSSFYKWAMANNLTRENLEKIEYKMWKNSLFLYDSWFYSKKSVQDKNLFIRFRNAGIFFLKRTINCPSLISIKYLIWTLIEVLNTNVKKQTNPERSLVAARRRG